MPSAPTSTPGRALAGRTAKACPCRRVSRPSVSPSSPSAAPPVTDVDLLDLAQGVAGAAREGEQIEAYAVRSRDVDVKAVDGEVEAGAVAVIEGVGVRVIGDRRHACDGAGC